MNIDSPVVPRAACEVAPVIAAPGLEGRWRAGARHSSAGGKGKSPQHPITATLLAHIHREWHELRHRVYFITYLL